MINFAFLVLSKETKDNIFFITAKNDTLTLFNIGPTLLWIQPLALLFWLPFSSHWVLFFPFSVFCLVFNLLPHCNNKPFISNTYQNLRQDIQDKRHIVVWDMSSLVYHHKLVFWHMKLYILLMLHWRYANSHCILLVGVFPAWPHSLHFCHNFIVECLISTNMHLLSTLLQESRFTTCSFSHSCTYQVWGKGANKHTGRFAGFFLQHIYMVRLSETIH